ncbi:E3 ubiquitin-protein ligase RFWD3 [Linum grandiflorum]
MAEPNSSDEELAEPVIEVSGGSSDSEEEEADSEDEESEEEFIPIDDSPPRVSDHNVPSSSSRVRSVYVEDDATKRRRVDEEVCSSNAGEGRHGSQGSQWNRAEIEGLFCSICMEAWTSEGNHHICCLPCGHLFGLSCINKWLGQKRSSGKCPQCNRKCTSKDVRKIFAPRIAVVDEESQRTIHSLEAKCASLEKKGADWCKKEALWRKQETELQEKVKLLTERTASLERLIDDLQNRPTGLLAASRGQHSPFGAKITTATSNFSMQVSSGSFELQEELNVDGGRLFDINISSQTLLVARRPLQVGGYPLTKISLMPPHGTSSIILPSSTGTIKDLHFCPRNPSTVLFVSLGKKVSILSLDSNNITLSFNLPCPAWSCSWDLNSPHHYYAGLQNGMLLAFDIRQTAKPLEYRQGLSTNPIHTIHSLEFNGSLPPNVRAMLSASSLGICQWNFESAEERPSLVPVAANQGVCISLAKSPSTDDIVASYRPKVETTPSEAESQTHASSSQNAGHGTQGSHLHLKRAGDNYEVFGGASATVSDIRLPRTVIIPKEKDHPSLFVSGDEVAPGLLFQALPSFAVTRRLLQPHGSFISDLKYAGNQNQRVLGCLRDTSLQLFTTKT